MPDVKITQHPTFHRLAPHPGSCKRYESWQSWARVPQRQPSPGGDSSLLDLGFSSVNLVEQEDLWSAIETVVSFSESVDKALVFFLARNRNILGDDSTRGCPHGTSWKTNICCASGSSGIRPYARYLDSPAPQILNLTPISGALAVLPANVVDIPIVDT